MRIKISQEKLVYKISQTIPILQKLLSICTVKEWRFRPAQGEWSISEIICHLRDVDREIHIPRIRALINEADPFIPGVASDDWAIERNYHAQNGQEALNEFIVSRAELNILFPPSGDDIWERRGRHTFFGPVTFFEISCLVLEHDELHIEQVKKNLAAFVNEQSFKES
ncbi:MAG: DinB family protein [Anaerolineales bacterium]|nr:DinB family protein [Anaerolineales bacterium]